MARPGRARRVGQTQRLELLALACESAQAQGRATPTLDEMVERGVVKQISRSHLQRILRGQLEVHAVVPDHQQLRLCGGYSGFSQRGARIQ